MIKYVTSNLFDSPAQTLVNTVNTVGVMGKGIAAEFKRRYPEMFARYREFCDRGELDIGKLYLYRTPNKWILNFPTKKHWRNPSTFEYIEIGLRKFAETYAQRGITSISFPQLGCGNGGLPWDDVRPKMHEILQEMPIPIYIHVAPTNERFVPEHDPRILKETLRERATVGFSRFWQDLQRSTGAVVGHDLAGDESHDFMDMMFGREPVRIYASELEDLWNVLRLRRALQPADFPASLHTYGDEFLEALLRLDYIKPIEFLRDSDHHRSAGIRFAPPPGESDPVFEFAAEA